MFKFHKKGISARDRLTFSLDQTIGATVVDDSHIELDGKRKTLSGATLELLQRRGIIRTSVQGTKYWLYEGVPVGDLVDIVDSQNSEQGAR